MVKVKVFVQMDAYVRGTKIALSIDIRPDELKSTRAEFHFIHFFLSIDYWKLFLMCLKNTCFCETLWPDSNGPKKLFSAQR